MTDVFLGGTCNGSKWRDELKPLLDARGISHFDPVVPDWTQEAQAREIRERETAAVCLYVLTPKMAGFYSVAEVADDSNKRPDKTVFCYLSEDDGEKFDAAQDKSLVAVCRLVHLNGATVAESLEHVADICATIVAARRFAA